MLPEEKYIEVDPSFKAASGRFINKLKRAIGRFFSGLAKYGRRKFTIMMVPDSEHKIFNFQISLWGLLLVGFVLISLISSFIWFSANYSGTNRLMALNNDQLTTSQVNLEMFRNEVNDLSLSAEAFEDTVNSTLDVLGIDDSSNLSGATGIGDLSSLFNVEELGDGGIREISRLQGMNAFFKDMTLPVEQIGRVLESQKELLVDIPTLYPLGGGYIGRLTNPFGVAENPFTGQWYIHTGVDLATTRGTPILSTANGQVVDVGYQPLGYGNYVIVRHKYGFYTRYAHMDRVLVSNGQTVVRGQQVGELGSTGNSTGPHLHYEVIIGSNLVDPLKYMNIPSDIVG